MSITLMADRRVTVYRVSPYVLDPTTVAASFPPSRQAAKTACIEVRVTNTTTPGTVTVHGIVAGVVDSETLTFPNGADVLATTKLFQNLNSAAAFTVTGLTGGTIVVEAVGRDGSRIETITGAMAVQWPMRMDRGLTKWPGKQEYGVNQSEETRFYMDWTSWQPREGDIFVDSLTAEEFMVIGVPTFHGGGMYIPHHLEVRVIRREGSASGSSIGGGGAVPTPTATFVADENVSAGDIVYITVDGRIALAESSRVHSPPRYYARGVAATAALAGNVCAIYLDGVVGVNFDAPPPASANGTVAFLSDTPGHAVLVPAGAGHASCSVGIIQGADGVSTTVQCLLAFSDFPVLVPFV
jgi:hypothetical protein